MIYISACWYSFCRCMGQLSGKAPRIVAFPFNNLRMQRHVDDLLIPVEVPSAMFRTARVDGAEEAMGLTMSSENAVNFHSSSILALPTGSIVAHFAYAFSFSCFFPAWACISYKTTSWFVHYAIFANLIFQTFYAIQFILLFTVFALKYLIFLACTVFSTFLTHP